MKDSWNANLYDSNHSFVSKHGNQLIELLAPKPGEKILDLGCGTGDLAQSLYNHKVELIGVDKSENMVAQATNKYPHIPFLVQDVTNLNFSDEFDAVFSNATLHWIRSAKQALDNIYKSLKQGGRFVAEFGGRGNVQIITNEIIHQLKVAGIDYKKEQFPWYFPSIAEYSSLMEGVGFRVIFAQHYDRPTPLDGDNGLRNWIGMFGNELFQEVDEGVKQEIITSVEDNLKAILYKEDQWIADYKRIRVLGVKKI